MNPEDFFSVATSFSKYNSVYNTLNSSYLNTGWNWNSDLYNQSYQDVKNNYIWLNVNYIGNDKIYIERPNCEDLINIKKLNPTVIIDNDLKCKAKYANSFDDMQDEGEGLVINNIEEIKVFINNTQKNISKDEFNLITTDKKFRDEMMNSVLTSISSNLLNVLESQVRRLDLNPNIYHEKFVEVINNLRDYLEITITDSFEDKLAIINSKTYEIIKIKPYEPDKVDDCFIEDLISFIASEFSFLINKDEEPAESLRRILIFLRRSNHKKLANKLQSYLNEMFLRTEKYD